MNFVLYAFSHLSNEVFVKYSYTIVHYRCHLQEFSFMNDAYASEWTGNHRQQHTSSVKRERKAHFADVEATVLLEFHIDTSQHKF